MKSYGIKFRWYPDGLHFSHILCYTYTRVFNQLIFRLQYEQLCHIVTVCLSAPTSRFRFSSSSEAMAYGCGGHNMALWIDIEDEDAMCVAKPRHDKDFCANAVLCKRTEHFELGMTAVDSPLVKSTRSGHFCCGKSE